MSKVTVKMNPKGMRELVIAKCKELNPNATPEQLEQIINKSLPTAGLPADYSAEIEATIEQGDAMLNGALDDLEASFKSLS